MIVVPSDAEELADVSFYQEGMDWTRYPHRAAMLRVGQNKWRDLSFVKFYEEARANNKALGGYFFYDDRVSPQAQADVINEAMLGRHFETELYIDVERTYGGPYFGKHHIRKLMELVEADVYDVGVYTGFYFWTSLPQTDDDEFFAASPLWLAWYSDPVNVKIPAPWKDYTLWQWGTPAIDWGQPTLEIDANKSRFSRDVFSEKYLKERVLKNYKVVWTNGVSRRLLPTTSSSTLVLPYAYGQIVEVVEDNIPDVTYPDNPDMRWVKFSDGLYGASDYPSGGSPAKRMEEVVSEPAPSGNMRVEVELLPDGTVSGTWVQN